VPVQTHAGDDEDDDHWVREQLRKGVGLSADQLSGKPAALSAAANGRAPGRMPGLVVPQAADSVAAAGENVLKVLREGLARLKVSVFCNVQCAWSPKCTCWPCSINNVLVLYCFPSPWHLDPLLQRSC
jgi:hypothetical protein